MRWPVVLASCLAAGAVIAPSSAIAGKHVRVKVRSGEAIAQADGELVSAIATCPKRTRAIAGGFSAELHPVSVVFVPYESRRITGRSWRISAGLNAQGSPEPAKLTAFAYCLKMKRRPFEVPARRRLPGASTAAPAARCPRGTRLLSGGFGVSAPDLTAPAVFAIVYASARSAKRAWLSSFANSAGPTRIASTYAYCVKGKHRKPLSKRVGTTALGPSAGISLATATTSPCPGGRRALSGGWFAGSVAPGGFLPLVYTSRRVGRAWSASALQLGSATGSYQAVAYCG
jgi:hypothetical protein